MASVAANTRRGFSLACLLPLAVLFGSGSVGAEDRATGRDLVVVMTLGLLAGSAWCLLRPRDLVERLVLICGFSFFAYGLFAAVSWGSTVTSDPRSGFAASSILTGLVLTEAISRGLGASSRDASRRTQRDDDRFGTSRP